MSTTAKVNNSSSGLKKKEKVFTYQELMSMPKEVAWMVHDGKVYDVKPFIPHHPGGELLIEHLLYSDTTDHIGKFHPPYVVD